MENAVNALEIVFGVLIFVLALSITMSMFGQARQSLQSIIDMRTESESYVTDSNGKYINYVNSNGQTREVGIETIVPMMYRAYRENFEVRLYGINNVSVNGVSLKSDTDNGNTYYYINLERENYANPNLAKQNLDALLTGGLYNELNGKTFYEKLGEYYQDDIHGTNENVAEINKTKKRVIIYIKK